MITTAKRLASTIVKADAATSRKPLSLDGVFIPLTTPFECSEDIAYNKLAENIAHYDSTSCSGYVVAGTNGEVPFLNPDERVDLVSKVLRTASRDKFVIGGATSESTKAVCELSQRMGDAGADAVLVMTPFYFKKRMTETAITEHFTTVADHSPIPVVIYNNVIVTGIDISIPTLTRLAGHPNIVGVKDGDVRKLSGIVLETKKKGFKFDALAGSAGYLLSSLQIGCSGGINGLAGALCKEVCDLYKLHTEHKWQEALDMHMRLTKADTLLLAELGVPGLKTAMDLLGLYGGPCRKPIQPSSPADVEKIKRVLLEDGFLKEDKL